MSQPTPMMRQYLEIKSQYPDAILFFRLGDFYEMFMEDAVTASRVLDITLTSRNKGSEEQIPLCGIPYHSCQPYIARLVEGGYKVAICEQVEDPRAVKGIVRREVVRVVTPGLVLDADNLSPKENNFLAALIEQQGRYGLACVDITTGDFRATELSCLEEVRAELASLCPRELVLAEGDDAGENLPGDLLEARMRSLVPAFTAELDRARNLLLEFYGHGSLEGMGCGHLSCGLSAAGMILHYLRETQKQDLGHLRPLKAYLSGEHMVLDDATRRNLELCASLQEGRKRGSLLGVLDRTQTAMGGRKLRHWINYPLVDVAAISERLDAVESLLEAGLLRMDLREALAGIQDLERLSSRISMAHANAKDLVALRKSLERLPAILALLAEFDGELLSRLRRDIDPMEDLLELICSAIVDEPPFVLREGNLIRDGFNPELDELRAISREGKGYIARLEATERERSGIGSLKVRFNKVFGYYIEITRSHLEKVPGDYERKQTLANAERYVTPALKEYEEKVLTAQDRITELEYELFQSIRQRTAAQGARIQGTAEALAGLDVLCGLADLAQDRRYVRPEVDESTCLRILEGRHPVIETMSLSEGFVPNDVELDCEQNQLVIITGPNMAGKSTFMRQVALITLMAQMGSFVPARQAHVGLVDRIFTRVGASDNLARGQSTFMVEMTETANILNNASARSLMVLDEIGRGTSTFDGVSIAWAVAEYLHDNPRVAGRTLFATHYHELTELAATRPRVKNFNIAVREWNEQIIFLRKIVPGATSHSYGIQVGRLAGLPPEVIARAREVLRNLESGEFERSGEPRIARKKGAPASAPSPQMTLFASREDPLRDRLRELDLMHTTPFEALALLQEIKRLI